jgi:hypothetical protein
MQFDFHCFSFSGGFSPALRAGRRREVGNNRELARLSGNSRHAALRQLERSPTSSDIPYCCNSEALIGPTLTLVSGKLRVVDSESTQKPVAYSLLSITITAFFECVNRWRGERKRQ